ncbi:MAG TPA: flagellar basal body-associated FliL family protein [Caulobacteraceae bacterium]|nr:flagellar basal body-associated FliL family protein [Caulobacteraceae bacterium]
MAKDKSKGKKEAEEADASDDAEAVEGEEGAEGGKKKLPLKMLIIAGAAAFVVLGGGGGAAFFLLAPKHPPEKPAHKLPAKPKGEKKDGKADPNAPQVQDGPDGVVFYTPPDIVVNMQTPDGKPTFLKLKVTFELPDHDTADTLDADMPRLQDVFQTFLRELRPEDLAGSEGTLRLRTELQRRVNLVIAPSKVGAVLIEEMLVN